MIPGAEHAPVVAVNLFRQPHISTPDDEAMAAFAQHERYAPGEPLLWRVGFDRVLHITPHPTTVRRLTVTDPDDQRVIWRLAALQLGASESEAQTARLRASLFRLGAGPERMRWSLIMDSEPMIVDTDLGNGYINRTVGRSHDPHLCGIGEAHDSAHATAALCAAMWGPA